MGICKIIDYETTILQIRKEHEMEIQQISKREHEELPSFEYHTIDKKWRISGKIKERKRKTITIDDKKEYYRIGTIYFSILDKELKTTLLMVKGEENSFHIFVSDLLSTKIEGTYTMGRFVPVIIEDGVYIIDFNLAFSPVCDHITTIGCPYNADDILIAIDSGELYRQPCIICNKLLFPNDEYNQVHCCNFYAHKTHLVQYLESNTNCPNCTEIISSYT